MFFMMCPPSGFDSIRKVRAPVDILQHARIVAFDQRQFTRVGGDDVARAGVAVECQQLRAEALAQTDRMAALPLLRGRDEMPARFDFMYDCRDRGAFDQW